MSWAGSDPRPSAENAADAELSTLRRRMSGVSVVTVLLVIGVVAETTTLVVQHSASVNDDDWKAVAARLASERSDKGTPVLFAPAWIEPLARLHLAKQLSLPLMTLSDVDRYARVWQVSARGARHPWLAGMKSARSFDQGGLQLELYERQPVKVLYDFYERLAEAQVDRAGHDLVRCRRNQHPSAGASGPRFRCDPKLSWNWVGWHLAEVAHRPYRCIYAQPVDGHRMRIAFDTVPIGETLVIYTGIDDFENRKRAKNAVLIQLFVADELVGSVRHLNNWPWRKTVFSTNKWAGKQGAVRFEITSPLAYARSFCFRAETRQ